MTTHAHPSYPSTPPEWTDHQKTLLRMAYSANHNGLKLDDDGLKRWMDGYGPSFRPREWTDKEGKSLVESWPDVHRGQAPTKEELVDWMTRYPKMETVYLPPEDKDLPTMDDDVGED